MPEPFKPTWDEKQRMKRSAEKLRHPIKSDGYSQKAATKAQSDRIDVLTKALKEISDLYVNAPGWAATQPSHAREHKMYQIARSALAIQDDVA